MHTIQNEAAVINISNRTFQVQGWQRLDEETVHINEGAPVFEIFTVNKMRIYVLMPENVQAAQVDSGGWSVLLYA